MMYMAKRFLFTKSISIKRLLNLFLCLYGLKMKKARLRSLPLKLTIDPCNVCNLRCVLCPTGQGLKNRKRSVMSFSDFEKIMDEVGDYLYEVALYNWGEPFLNKEICRMIRLLKKRKIKAISNSNMNVRLTEAEAEEIVRSGLDTLIVSMDGITQETYEKYRVGGDLELVKNNVRMISGAKKRIGSKKPELIWQFLVNKYNESEVPALEGIRNELGFDALWLGRLRCDIGMEIFLDQNQRYESAKKLLPSERYSRYDSGEKKERREVKSCYFLWTTAAINPDGSVSPCCALYNQAFDFGNVFEGKRSFREVWNGEKYMAARKTVAGQRSGIVTVCSICARHGFIQS
jgi:radical SAM protein with 4Fe4S-binding SPASM domain